MSLVIKCKRLFDGQKIIENGTVVINEDKIVAVYTGGDPSAPESSSHGKVIHCQFAMPGLIDSHVHVTGYHEGSPAGAPFQPMINFMRLLIYNGVTTVRDTGNSIEIIKYLREWGNKNAGPRIFSSGPVLDSPPLTWPYSRAIYGPEAAYHEVKLLHLEGMDFIKTYRNITPRVLKAIVEAASSYKMDVATDVKNTFTHDACRLGVRSLEHVINLISNRDFPDFNAKALTGVTGLVHLWGYFDPQSDAAVNLLRLLAKNQTYICPTLLVSHRYCSLEAMVNEPYLDYMRSVMPYHKYFKRMRGFIGRVLGAKFIKNYLDMPSLSKSEQAEVDLGLRNMRSMIGCLYDAGVNIVVGTDSPNPSIVPGFSLHQEMKLLGQSGMPSLAVLKSATSVPAKLLRQDNLGIIRPDAYANIVLLNADPAVDISNTMHVQSVIKDGRVIDREKVFEKIRQSLG